MKQRRARAEVQPVVDQIVAWAANHQLTIEFGGSWRRGCDTVGDVDVVIFTDSLHGIELPGTTEPWRDGRYCAQLEIDNIQVDMWACLPQHAGPFLWFITGPKELNIQMRSRAKELGWKLNQTHLEGFDGPVDTEQQVAAALGLPYLTPAERQRYVKYQDVRPGEQLPIVGESGTPYLIVWDDDGTVSCTCPGFAYRHRCKHVRQPARFASVA